MLTNKYNNSRSNLILVAVFTAINIIILATGSYTYFLFSASIPYILTDTAMFLCGMYPEEFYTEEYQGMEFLDSSFFVISLIISAVIVAVYLLCYFLSKNKVGWLVFSLVFFIVDTVGMFYMYGISTDMIIDFIFHAWVIVSLCMGINAHSKLAKLPPEEWQPQTYAPTESEPRDNGSDMNSENS